jgi:hypothetical protein
MSAAAVAIREAAARARPTSIWRTPERSRRIQRVRDELSETQQDAEQAKDAEHGDEESDNGGD